MAAEQRVLPDSYTDWQFHPGAQDGELDLAPRQVALEQHRLGERVEAFEMVRLWAIVAVVDGVDRWSLIAPRP